MCRVFVGDDEEPYTIHQDLIASSSGFSKGSFRTQMKQSSGDVELPAQKCVGFGNYYKWLCSGKVDDFDL